ncbi:MAG: MBL fold metallo-hydrolase [Candidatus Thermoplasmatota archaeon]
MELPKKKESAGHYKPELDKNLHAIKLWGTRGSTPVSNPGFMRHGGNTACLSIETCDEMVIIDAGTGIRELGLHLISTKFRKLHIFIGHTHWDHIQGFPFFTPAYLPGFELVIYGASGFGKNIKSVFKGQLDRDYFPVQLEDMHSNMSFRDLADSPVKIGDVDVFWDFVNHAGSTIGFKIGIGKKTVGYVTDNEFLEGYTGVPHNIDIDHDIVIPYRKMIEFVSDANILIHDAQYTNDEYPAKIGWGHSSVSNTCVLAKLAGVKKWFVTHHDPMYDDDFLNEKLVLTRQILQEIDCPTEVENAFDGMVLYV